MSAGIGDWISARTLHPVLDLTAGLAVPDVLAEAQAAFEAAGYRTLAADETTLRVRHHDWFAIAAGKWERTELALEGRRDPQGATVRVRVLKGANNTQGRRRAVEALDDTVARLRARGADPRVGAWQRPD